MDVWLKQSKFHQVVLKKYFIKPLSKEEQTIRSFLTYYQEIACQAYPTEALMEEALGTLYDAKFRVFLTNQGTYSLYCYCLYAPDPNYIKDSSYTIERLEKEFNKFIIPAFANDEVLEEIFYRAYEIYESDLIHYQENLVQVSLDKMLSYYFKGTNRDFSFLGNLEELKKITPKSLYSYYFNLIKEEHITIGTGNYPNYEKDNISLHPKMNYTFTKRLKGKESYILESYTSNQSYLHILYETHIYATDKLYYACKLLNYLIGAGSASLLFKTIREEDGLCYLIHSTYYAATGIFIISASIDSKNVNKVEKRIDEVLKGFLNQDLDSKLEEAKQYYIGLEGLGKDNIETKLQNYLCEHYFPEMPKAKNEISKINAVKNKDILKAYQLLEKNFTYVLGGQYEK